MIRPGAYQQVRGGAWFAEAKAFWNESQNLIAERVLEWDRPFTTPAEAIAFVRGWEADFRRDLNQPVG